MVGLKALFLVHIGLVPIPKLPKVPPQAPTLWASLVSHILLMYPRTLTLNRMVPSSVPWNCGLGTLMKLCARLSSKQLTNMLSQKARSSLLTTRGQGQALPMLERCTEQQGYLVANATLHSFPLFFQRTGATLEPAGASHLPLQHRPASYSLGWP